MLSSTIGYTARPAVCATFARVGASLGVQHGPSLVNYAVSKVVEGTIPRFLAQQGAHAMIGGHYATIGAAIAFQMGVVAPSPSGFYNGVVELAEKYQHAKMLKDRSVELQEQNSNYQQYAQSFDGNRLDSTYSSEDGFVRYQLAPAKAEKNTVVAEPVVDMPAVNEVVVSVSRVEAREAFVSPSTNELLEARQAMPAEESESQLPSSTEGYFSKGFNALTSLFSRQIKSTNLVV